jgi:proteasome beta subunit
MVVCMHDDPGFIRPGTVAGSFTDYLREVRPDLLPSDPGPVTGVAFATTILALRFREGVVIAGDRRATEGYAIAHRDIEKVFPTDSFSAVAISGAAGPSVELVRLFQTELEHYEKQEGEYLSLDGKANYLGRMIRGNLPAAMQGLVVLPLFAGFEPRTGDGRIYRYDVTGGHWQETDYHATGSGGSHAKNTLKKLYRHPEDIDRERAVRLALEALADAAEEDAGTAGPDPVHGIYPTVFAITADGVVRVQNDEIESMARQILSERTEVPRTGSGDMPAANRGRE